MQAISIEDAIQPLVLTLDVGTSAVRLLCFDAQARQINGIEAVVQSRSATMGMVRVKSTSANWVGNAMPSLIRSFAQLWHFIQYVVAIAVDTMATTMVGLSADGIPVLSITHLC
jgi:sugar (pentulose or hexulose) kinase